MAAAFVEGLEPWTTDPRKQVHVRNLGSMRGPGASRLPADKLEAEMLETLVNMLLRHPSLSSAGCPGSPGEPILPCHVISKYTNLARCLQANQLSIKNQWVWNLSWKKLAQNQLLTWNVSSTAPSKIFHQLLFTSPCPIHGLWQQLKKYHFWPTYSMMFFTSSDYAQPICSSLTRNWTFRPSRSLFSWQLKYK